MTRLPDGALEPLPELLYDIEISVSNLTALPEDLRERWHELRVFYLEHSLARVFSETMLKLEVHDLSLTGSQLEASPNLFETLQSNCFVLALSHNKALKALRAVVTDGLTIDFLALENTNIEEPPGWVDASVTESVHLAGTPLCRAQDSSTSTAATFGNAKYLCDQVDARGGGRYPLAVTERIRRP